MADKDYGGKSAAPAAGKKVTIDYATFQRACDDAGLTMRQCRELAERLGLGNEPMKPAPVEKPPVEEEDEDDAPGLMENP